MSSTPQSVHVPSRPGLKVGSTGDETRALHEVLEHFGLLTFDAHDGQEYDELVLPLIGSVAGFESEFTDATESALRRLQVRWNLQPTGILDDDTFDAMRRIACFSSAANAANALTMPTDSRMTYAILDFPSGLNAARVAAAVSQAFAFWAAATPLSFRRVSGNSADITIRFPSLGGPEGVLGNALIELDDDERWRIGLEEENIGGQSYDLISSLVHELGHKLGLNHDSSSQSVMNEYQNHNDEHRQISGYDAAAIQKIHGQQKLLSRPVIHGNSARAEHPERLARIRPTGPGGIFIGDSEPTWLHIGPTIPNVIQNGGVRLHRVKLKLRVFSGARVTEVHVWDGDRILEKHVLELTSSAPEMMTLDLGVASKPALVDGVEISIGVAFTNRQPTDRRIDVISAGCDLIDRADSSGTIFV